MWSLSEDNLKKCKLLHTYVFTYKNINFFRLIKKLYDNIYIFKTKKKQVSHKVFLSTDNPDIKRFQHNRVVILSLLFRFFQLTIDY